MKEFAECAGLSQRWVLEKEHVDREILLKQFQVFPFKKSYILRGNHIQGQDCRHISPGLGFLRKFVVILGKFINLSKP